MATKQQAIAAANAILHDAGLPGYDELASLLRAAENKLGAMQTYHSGSSKQAIGSMRDKIRVLTEGIPVA